MLDQLGDDTVLESLETDGGTGDLDPIGEVIEAGVVGDDIDATLAADSATDELLDEVAAGADQKSATLALYAEQDAPAAAGDEDTPVSDPAEVATAATEGKKKGGKKKDAAAMRLKEPKPPRATLGHAQARRPAVGYAREIELRQA